MLKTILICLLLLVLPPGCAYNTKPIAIEHRATANIQKGTTKTFKREAPYYRYNFVNPARS